MVAFFFTISPPEISCLHFRNVVSSGIQVKDGRTEFYSRENEISQSQLTPFPFMNCQQQSPPRGHESHFKALSPERNNKDQQLFFSGIATLILKLGSSGKNTTTCRYETLPLSTVENIFICRDKTLPLAGLQHCHFKKRETRKPPPRLRNLLNFIHKQ